MPRRSDSTRPSGDRLGALLSAAVDPIVLIDLQGRISGFNRAAESVFGYREDEVRGRPVSMLMPGPYRDEHDGYMSRYLATGQRRIIGIGREVTALRADGSTFPIDLSVGEYINGGEHGFVGILRDISRRKAQEAELQKTTAELRLIFANTPTAIAILDRQGLIVDLNHAAETLLGFEAAALCGRPHAERVVAEDRAALAAGLAGIAASGERLSLELRYRRADGSLLQAQLQAGVAFDADGEALLTICEIVDRRPLYEATREAEDLRTRLAHVARIGTLGEMVSGIAHEVNQPLTAIANYASAARRFLRAGIDDKEELAAILDKIATQAERAGQVIRGLRSLSRRRDAVRERLEVGSLIAEVARLVEFELRARGWRLQIEVADGLPAISGDAVQIQQVLLNLIRNGLEAMADQGGGDSVEVCAMPVDDGGVEITVRDSGPGVPAAVEDRLFEPFYTTKTQGMGLGLSICQSIMAAHGGGLHYRRGEPGQGACFVMRLPLALATPIKDWDESHDEGNDDG